MKLPRTPLSFAVPLALMLVGPASPSQAALIFNFTPAGGTSAQAISGFAAAGALWSNQFTDNITVNINIAFTNLGAGILGQASSTQNTYAYSAVRNAMIGDATSTDDATATANLQAGPLKILTNNTSNNPNGANSPTPYLDNNGGANNTTIRMTNANAKALGLLSATNSAVDASISFSSAFSFDFDRSDGISAGAFDFVGIAAHEIGHSLGFISGVDVLDLNPSGFSDDAFTFVSTLDLFRYSTASAANGAIDFTAGTATKYFSITGGATSTGATFSTGVNLGDGNQASHWKDGAGIGLLDPTAAPGELLAISANDIQAFDVMGYNLNLAPPTSGVPEPSTFAGAGLALVFTGAFLRRNRRAA